MRRSFREVGKWFGEGVKITRLFRGPPTPQPKKENNDFVEEKILNISFRTCTQTRHKNLQYRKMVLRRITSSEKDNFRRPPPP